MNIENARVALETLNNMNRLRNDFDVYCYNLALWGLGLKPDENGEMVCYGDEIVDAPNPKDYGL